MHSLRCDYAIIGTGCAGYQLALRMAEDEFFSNKKILLIEPDEKQGNDRTWSYWEEGQGRWDHLVWKSWSAAEVHAEGFDALIPLAPYRYKSIRSADFYRHAQAKLRSSGRFHFVRDTVETVIGSDADVLIQTRAGDTYIANTAFDSRIDPAFFGEQPGYSKVWQHFLGWEVESDSDVFDPENFTMMDFRLRYKDTCSFMYILPQDERCALVEFTFFSPDLVDRSVYEQMLKEYLMKYFPGAIFRRTGEEFGVIPMSDYPFHKHGSENIIKIGTAGSWAKPATGYSFKNTERCIDRLIDNLHLGVHSAQGLISKKHRIYDTLFLDLLHHQNEIGPALFGRMYSRNPIARIFRFLDDRSTLADDLRIMWTFDALPFMKVIGKKSLQILKGLRS